MTSGSKGRGRSRLVPRLESAKGNKMHRSSFKLLVAIGLAPSLAACGDDEPSNGDVSGTSTGDTDTAPSTMSGSGSATASTSSSGNTDSATGESSSSSSGDPSDTDPSSGSTAAATDSATEGDTESDTDGATMGSSSSGGESGDEEGTTGDAEFCEAPGMLTPCDDGTDDPFQAMGLNCGGADPNTFIPIVNDIFSSTDGDAWRIARQFGTYINPGTGLPQWAPREGDSFLLISTGVLGTPSAAGVLTAAAGSTQTGSDNDNADYLDAGSLPAPISPDEGSNNGAGGTPFINCDGVNDCSDSLWGQWTFGGAEANDMMWFQFETPVPGGTHGFSFDFAYFSAEFPEFVDTTYNDVFAVWSSSETYTGNLCFVNDEPCTVTALGPSVAYTAADPELGGTGFNTVGESTDWFNAKGSAEPGEDLLLTFILFDMGDSIYDTTVILDNFQWDCEGCVPSEVDPCIGIDPV
jgi:hypothetical protein